MKGLIYFNESSKRYATVFPDGSQRDLSSGSPVTVLIDGEWHNTRIEHQDCYGGYYLVGYKDKLRPGLEVEKK